MDPGPPQKGPSQIVYTSRSLQSFLPIHLQPGLVLPSSLAMVTGVLPVHFSFHSTHESTPPHTHTHFIPSTEVIYCSVPRVGGAWQSEAESWPHQPLWPWSLSKLLKFIALLCLLLAKDSDMSFFLQPAIGSIASVNT